MYQRTKHTAALICAVLALPILACCKEGGNGSSLYMEGEPVIALNRSSRKARIADPSKSSYLYFKFTDHQRERFEAACFEGRGASLCVLLSFDTDYTDVADLPFALGLIFDEDINDNGTLKASVVQRQMVVGNFTEAAGSDMWLAFSIAQRDMTPAGFFVYSVQPVSVKEVRLGEPMLGWQRGGTSEEGGSTPPLFAFGPSGGRVRWDFARVYLGDGVRLFPDQNLPTRVMPEVNVGIAPQEDAGTLDEQRRVVIQTPKESLSLRLCKGQTLKVIQTSAFDYALDRLDITEGSREVTGVLMVHSPAQCAQDMAGSVLYPLTTDLGLIEHWCRANWRRDDYELYRWELFPTVLFFDFADYATQNLFLTRLAYFVEKEGYRGTFVSDEFVATKHGYNAHDYKTDDLAHFFDEAVRQDFPLNRWELLLRQILLANGIIVRSGAGYAAGDGAVVSFSRESADYLRRTFLSHESWHGIYFTDADFRRKVAGVYSSFDDTSLEFIKEFWRTQPGLGYDTADEYLMQNEFMAYIMQQSASHVREYFLQVAGRDSVNRFEPKLARYIRETHAQAFVDAAGVLNEYAFDRWGLACGRVWLTSRQ